MTTRRAACSCGQLHLAIEGEPSRISMCHCLECQRRTGAVIPAAAYREIGGVAGATLGFRLGSMLSFYVAADDYIYGTRIDETTLQADKKTQNDVHLAVGFGIPLGR